MITTLLVSLFTWAADAKQLGIEAAARGHFNTAATHFAAACENAPGDEDACYFLGRTLYTLARYSEARTAFEKASRAAPADKRERAARAAALNFVALDLPEEAEARFRDAVRAHLGGEDSRVDFGAFLTRQGRATEAAALLEAALKNQPQSARANAELGRALMHLGRTVAAVPRLERALRLDPKLSDIRLLLGRAYLTLGRTAEGERELRHGSSTAK
ncbi:MAG: tetratricopeptide repeat protein [Acidobacteria bacterium]|nr:tetratricopeptide repeat protein [Acidobacteriota bacterium]